MTASSSKSSTTDRAPALPSSPANTPPPTWHQLVDDPTLADALLDRVVHHAHLIELNGESLRKKRPPKAPKTPLAEGAATWHP
ncbi:MAG: ATP-binding protein [Candidatus Handelsmanbacteria bacterium]|nr:ATP-binding protein [Candidatus Handelsmanbacteria bacterium]